MEQKLSTDNSAAKKDVIVISRRSFFGALLAIGTAGMGAILSVPVLRYVLYPLYAKTSGISWSEVGNVSDFARNGAPVRKTITFAQRDGWRRVESTQSVYVNRNSAGEFEILSSICPHLGCSVSWQKNADDFLCPCHGSVFTPHGKLVKGPSPRGMDPLPHRVQDGKLQVRFEFFREDVHNRQVIS